MTDQTRDPVAMALEALKPFDAMAEELGRIEPDAGDRWWVYIQRCVGLNHGDFRRARDTYAFILAHQQRPTAEEERERALEMRLALPNRIIDDMGVIDRATIKRVADFIFPLITAREVASHPGHKAQYAAAGEVLGALTPGFMTCAGGVDRPYVQVAFETLAEAQRLHRALILLALAATGGDHG